MEPQVVVNLLPKLGIGADLVRHGYFLMRKVWLEVTRKVILVGFGYGEPNAIGHAEHSSRSHDAVICVYDDAGNVIQTHEYKGDFKEP